MTKSRLRGGATAHRKRVKARNERIRGARKKVQREYEKMLMDRMSEISQKYSGDTPHEEQKVEVDVLNTPQPDETTPLDLTIK